MELNGICGLAIDEQRCRRVLVDGGEECCEAAGYTHVLEKQDE